MRKITKQWLIAANEDLQAAEKLLSVQGLTNLVVFHCQQCVEKSLKALLEEKELPNIKTHDLLRIYQFVNEEFKLPDPEKMVQLNELYVNSRYPGDLGLLPDGKPTFEESNAFLTYAKGILKDVRNHIGKYY
jgi:HEPN domain-containing protein